MKILWSAHTVEGKRKFNEDAYYADSEKGLFMLLDGMGGPGFGEEATRRVSFYVAEFLESMMENEEATWPYERLEKLTLQENILRVGFLSANERLYKEALQEYQKEVMGTSLLIAQVKGRKLILGHAGTCHAYLLRDGYLSELTEDHSYAAEKRIVPLRSEKNISLSVLGLQEKLPKAQFKEKTLKKGDRILLVSDGVSLVVSNQELQRILNKNSHDLHAFCEEMTSLAESRDTSDNATAFILEVGD
ncbi:MAG: serine/threonine-protein phosphatase [Deltaproteobacteria bacterium]|nr:serine/threonine-protein phosphatase [Deltaproteobacteria bacterium]